MVTLSAKTTWLLSEWDPSTTNAEKDKYSEEDDVFPDFLVDFYPIYTIKIKNLIRSKESRSISKSLTL